MNDDLLVGSTGFVGGNLIKSHVFKKQVHASNISEAYDTHPDLCVYAGVPSAMFLANQNPDADLDIMRQARKNVQLIKPRKLVLISTIAVYDDSRGKDENSAIDESVLPAYGKNRFQLEQWIRSDFPNSLIVRLPALYGYGLKKNFINDLICIYPPLLRNDKYIELSKTSELVRDSYEDCCNGFYKVKDNANRTQLKKWFSNSSFNALSFTDSRSTFQFYGLKRLWSDISDALEREYNVFNIATPPISAAQLYKELRGRDWSNRISNNPFCYDMRSMHTRNDRGESSYIYTIEEEIESVREFVEDGLCR